MKRLVAVPFHILLVLSVLVGVSSCGLSPMGNVNHSGQMLYWVNAAPLVGGIYAGPADGNGTSTKILFNPYSPDAIEIDIEEKRIYFTNMTLLDSEDANLMRADIEENELTNIIKIVPNGLGVRTPKQLVLSKSDRKVYFADREGRRVYRVPMDGVKVPSDLEILVDFSSLAVDQHQFVGVAVDEEKQLFYWTDRLTNTLWRASTNASKIITPDNVVNEAFRVLKYDQGMLLEIDIDHINEYIYFTDRGEGNELIGETLPAGFVGRVNLNDIKAGHEVVVPNLLKDPVGLSVSPETGFIYYSTSEDCKIFKRSLDHGDTKLLYQGRPFCEGMKFVDWDKGL